MIFTIHFIFVSIKPIVHIYTRDKVITDEIMEIPYFTFNHFTNFFLISLVPFYLKALLIGQLKALGIEHSG